MARVLLVEDESVFQAELTKALERKGFDVVVAPSVAFAKTNIARRAIDLVVCDNGLKGSETGLDLHRWLVDQKSPLATKFIFIGSQPLEEQDKTYVLSAQIRHVPKPFSFRELYNAVDAVL